MTTWWCTRVLAVAHDGSDRRTSGSEMLVTAGRIAVTEIWLDVHNE